MVIAIKMMRIFRPVRTTTKYFIFVGSLARQNGNKIKKAIIIVLMVIGYDF
jgi:hypothetical protein